MTTTVLAPLTVERVRHPLRIRHLQVHGVDQISPRFLRMRLVGDDLADFVSASFDDHLKLILPPEPGAPLVLPVLGPDGRSLSPGGERPTMRDYTPRQFDPAARWLDLEFLLHSEGRATEWAAQAQPGDEVGVGGPRGSSVVPTGFDTHVLIGDETAMPAIARRLEELPQGTQVRVVIETADPADRRRWQSQADVQTQWVQSGAVSALAQAVSALTLPTTGETHAWAAGEAASMLAVRQVLVDGHGLDKSRVRASAYWKRGSAGYEEAA